jgi:hypothetical protein
MSVTDLKVLFTLRHRNQADTPSREMSFMWDPLSTIELAAGERAA